MARIKLGELDLMQGKVKDALRKFESRYEMFASYRPKDVKLLFIIGDCYLRLKKYDEAAEVFREILQKDSENLEAYQKLTSLQEMSD